MTHDLYEPHMPEPSGSSEPVGTRRTSFRRIIQLPAAAIGVPPVQVFLYTAPRRRGARVP